MKIGRKVTTVAMVAAATFGASIPVASAANSTAPSVSSVQSAGAKLSQAVAGDCSSWLEERALVVAVGICKTKAFRVAALCRGDREWHFSDWHQPGRAVTYTCPDYDNALQAGIDTYDFAGSVRKSE